MVSQGTGGNERRRGFALFYGRDNDLFGKVEDLAYFFPKDGDYSRYYLELTNTFSVSGAVPVIAVSKNGYPLLPDHDHDLEGNVDYNTFNAMLSRKGLKREIGLVKNVSGPFIAGLANLDGVYGGYRNETSGDCIRVVCMSTNLSMDRAILQNIPM